MNAQNRPLSKQRLRVWLKMLAAQRTIETRLRERLRLDHDSTLPRFDVLSALDRYRDGLRMSDLSARLKVSNGNVTGIVERLVSEALVERVAVDGDRRAMRVRLTEAGIARFAAMAADHETWVNEMMAGVSATELDSLIDLLDRMGEHSE
ncbi:MarR family transcriptional regulator [Pseudooceanicola lipolyticus]|uniref:MarR family transcriptional regulator n=1 Tax=Pseudooceanicola lipolyticus TaxID=2029104 RepID=A0A2M8IX46_9RHOB|nr:MarR family transcriptional regulator [Pseudooceanicola lipolyticus]PJE35092.1 MarR family transcriptional regulator [Pseudooceanicola lipolyticus]